MKHCKSIVIASVLALLVSDIKIFQSVAQASPALGYMGSSLQDGVAHQALQVQYRCRPGQACGYRGASPHAGQHYRKRHNNNGALIAAGALFGAALLGGALLSNDDSYAPRRRRRHVEYEDVPPPYRGDESYGVMREEPPAWYPRHRHRHRPRYYQEEIYRFDFR